MKNNLFFLLITFSFTAIFSCKKEKMPENNCEDIEILYSGGGFPLFPAKQNLYSYPDFNPSNLDEIIFTYKETISSNKSKLLKYNILTKEYEEIFEGLVQSQVRWGTNDWILLSLKEEDSIQFDIWKIKSNGDSLTQLTFSGNCFFGEWSLFGEQFTYQLGNLNPNLFVVSNTETLETDTFINGLNDWGSWQHPSKFTYTDVDGLIVGDFIENNLERIYTIENPRGGDTGAEWIDETNIVWTDEDGIYISNIDTKSRETIISTCNSENYRLPAYSRELDKILLIRVSLIATDNPGSIPGGIDLKGEAFHELVMMNLDGSGKEVIKIEE